MQYVSYQPANIGFLSLVIVKITERDHYAFTSYGPLYVLPVIEAVAVDARSPALVQGFGNIANAIGHRVACVVQRNDPARVQFLERLVQAVAISRVGPRRFRCGLLIELRCHGCAQHGFIRIVLQNVVNHCVHFVRGVKP